MPEKPEPAVVGDVNPQSRALMLSLQAQSREITLQIGRLELQKAEMLDRIKQINIQFQNVVNAESKRLGIPDGSQWQMTPEGKALVLVPPTPPPAAAAPAPAATPAPATGPGEPPPGA